VVMGVRPPPDHARPNSEGVRGAKHRRAIGLPRTGEKRMLPCRRMVTAWPRRTQWTVGLLRVLVVALLLLLPLASAGALPSWALLVRGEGGHVCHCSIEKHDCVCAKCNPDRDDLSLTSESLSGRCGDDEIAFGGKALRAVLPAPFGRVPLSSVALEVLHPHAPTSRVKSPPPTPPPRTRASREV
jgi:hypothetical protein